MKYLLTICFICALISCQYSQEAPAELSKGFLYLYDTDGKGGTGSGNFGDIAFYDFENNKQYILLEDRYFDEYPCYSNLFNRIYFQSLRDYQTMTGISGENNIYYFDVGTCEVKRFDDAEFYAKYELSNRHHSRSPRLNKVGDKIVFSVSSKNKIGKSDIVIFDIKNDSLLTVLNDWRFPTNFTWVSNNNLFFTVKSYSDSICHNSYINIYDKDYPDVGELLFRECQSLSTSDFYLAENRADLLMIQFNIEERKEYIEIFDLRYEKTTFLLDVKDYNFDEVSYPIFFSKDEIAFIGKKEIYSENPISDIYILNLTTKKLRQLTNDGHMKDHLSYIQ